MTEHDDKPNHSDRTFLPLVECWSSAVGQATENAKHMPGRPDSNIDPRAWRRQWFDALGQTTEAYLRSPLFLAKLKAHVDTLVAARRRLDSGQHAPRSPCGELTDDIRAMRSRLKQLQEQLDLLKETSYDWTETGSSQQSPGSREVPQPPPTSIRGVTSCEVVYEEGMLKLLRYRNDAVRFAEPILVCFALVNRPYILDLKENRSVVRRLLDRGFDVYLIDWGTPGEADSQLSLEDYICTFLRNVVNFVCTSAGTPQLNLLGYCMGGTMATMFTALQPLRVRNLILMATPIDFAGDEGLLNLWSREEYFDVDQLIDTFGNCPGELLQLVFQLMKPVQNFAEKHLTLCENLHDAAFMDNFVAVERWSNDSIPVVGETFRQYVKSLYQQNRLVKGQMCLSGVPVRLEAITCPLLLLVAEKDHLVPPDSTLALMQYVSSTDTRSLSINAGHVGLAVSSNAHRHLWPEAANWIANHSTEI